MKIQTNQNLPKNSSLARGFSLFEMVIVMGIIGLILSGAIYSMGRMKDAAAVNKADTDMATFRSALEMYKTNGGMYPSTSQGLESLIRKPTDAPRPRNWVSMLDDESKLLDPWGTMYKYQFPGSKDPSRPEISSAGPDTQFGTDDDLSSQKGQN